MALRLLNVTHRYGAHTALDGVSLHVREGDCYGFLGHNGAGKTTAMRIALGLIRPTSGTVLVDGFDASTHPVEARARLGGLIETPGFHGAMGGLRNLELLARAQGMGRRDAAAEAARVLGEVGLLHAATKPVGAYSQGMRQRLGIAQALLGRPAVVLLDEPTNGLDPEGIEQMRALLRRLTREEGTTVLLSSHQLHELSGLCNRVAILREGRVLVEDETSRLVVDSRRHLLRAGDDAAAATVLTNLGLPFERHDGGLLVEVPGDGAARVLAALVEGRAAPMTFSPRLVSLEDVYLRLTREGTNGHSVADAAPTVAAHAPAERRAPGGPTRRAAGYELRRWRASWAIPTVLALPALAAAGAVLLRKLEAGGFASEVAGGELASTTDVTAFEAVGVGLQAGLPVLAVVAAGLASQSLAGELARGTLRNLLLRPFRRRHVATGKAVANLLASVASYALLVAVTLAAAALAFDFTDVTEILFNGERFPLVAAEELHEPLRQALLRPLPAIAAFAGLGFVAGAITRGPAAALGLALGLVLVPDVLRSVLRGFDLEWVVPSAHVPTVLGDTSYVAQYLDLSRGVSNAAEAALGPGVWVPLAWLATCLLVAIWTLSRRSIR